MSGNVAQYPSFICFIGLDGSGKTTQCQALADALSKQGIKTKYYRCLLGATFMRLPLLIGKGMLASRGRNVSDYGERAKAKRRWFRNRFIAIAFQYLWLADFIPQTFFKIKLPMARGSTIVCDRYIYDAVVHLAADFNYSMEKIQGMVKGLFRLVPKPDLVFLTDLPEEMAYHRNLPKGDINSVDYFYQRRKIYLAMAEHYGMTILDSTRDLDEIKHLVMSKVNEI